MFNWLPHRMCLNNDVWLMTLTVLGNIGIAFAYYVISLHIALLAKRRIIGPIIGTELWQLFAAFIFLCGTTHVMDVLVLWFPIYRLQTMVTFVTGMVSLWTMVSLIVRALYLTGVVTNGDTDRRFEMHKEIVSGSLERLKQMVHHEGDSH